MIFAEDFECRIPSGNAVKGDIIYCSAPPTNGWEITGFLVDALVALGTVGSVGIAVWVALDARKRVAEERARAEKAERETRIRDAGAKVVSAFSAYIEDIESADQSKFYAVPNANLNLTLAYGDANEEGLALYGALSSAHRELLQPVFFGYLNMRMAVSSKQEWQRGIETWRRKLIHVVASVRNLFDGLNATDDPDMRTGLILSFAQEMEFAAKSLKVSMSNFLKEEQ